MEDQAVAGDIRVRVSSRTSVHSLGRRLYEEHREGVAPPILSCIGEPSLRVAFQGVIEANRLLAPTGKHLVILPRYLPPLEPEEGRSGDAFGMALRVEGIR